MYVLHWNVYVTNVSFLQNICLSSYKEWEAVWKAGVATFRSLLLQVATFRSDSFSRFLHAWGEPERGAWCLEGCSPGARLCCFRSRPCCLVALCPWVSYLTSLKLSFFIRVKTPRLQDLPEDSLS